MIVPEGTSHLLDEGVRRPSLSEVASHPARRTDAAREEPPSRVSSIETSVVVGQRPKH
jgi:hypothetical protein